MGFPAYCGGQGTLVGPSCSVPDPGFGVAQIKANKLHCAGSASPPLPV